MGMDWGYSRDPASSITLWAYLWLSVVILKPRLDPSLVKPIGKGELDRHFGKSGHWLISDGCVGIIRRLYPEDDL